MAPPRIQNVTADEVKSEAAGPTKNRHPSSTVASTNHHHHHHHHSQQQHQPPQAPTSTSRSRRNGHASAAGGGAAKSAAAANAASAGTTVATATHGSSVGATGQSGQASGTIGINWSAAETRTLHAYRHLYRLQTPSAFKSTFNQMVLSNPGIGRLSPTMVGRTREKRRVGKEQLALAVRKHFNAMAVAEMDVIPEFLNRAQNDHREFRLRFGPRLARRGP